MNYKELEYEQLLIYLKTFPEKNDYDMSTKKVESPES